MSSISGRQKTAIIIMFMLCSTMIVGILSGVVDTPLIRDFLKIAYHITMDAMNATIDQRIRLWNNLGLGGSPYQTAKSYSASTGNLTIGGTNYYYLINGANGKMDDYSTDGDDVLNWMLGNYTGRLYIRAGHYYIDEDLEVEDNSEVYGEYGATIIHALTNLNDDMFDLQGNENISIHDMVLDGNAANQSSDIGDGIQGYGASYVEVYNMIIKNTKDFGVGTSRAGAYCTSWLIHDNLFFDIYDNFVTIAYNEYSSVYDNIGWRCSDVGYTVWNSNHTTFTNCKALDIKLNVGTGGSTHFGFATEVNSRDTKFINCQAIGVTAPLIAGFTNSQTASWTEWHDCYVEYAEGGWYIARPDATMRDCTVFNITGGDDAGVWLAAGSSGAIITNLKISSAGRGVIVQANVDDVQILDSHFDTVTTAVLINAATSDRTRVLCNTFTNVGTALSDSGTDTIVHEIQVMFVDTGVSASLWYRGQYFGIRCEDAKAEEFRFSFIIPDNYYELAYADIVVLYNGGNATGNIRWQVNSEFATSGEDYQTHTDATGVLLTGITQDLIEFLDASTVFDGITARDVFGGHFVRWGNHADDTVGESVLFMLLRFGYV